MPASADVIKIAFAVEGVAALKATFDTVEQRMVKFDRAATASTQAGAKARVAAAKKEVDQREKEYAQLVKQTEKWEREQTKDAQRAARDRERAVEQEERRKLTIRENSMRQAHRLLEQEVREERRLEEQAARQAAATRRQYASRVTGAMGAGFGAVGTIGSRLLAMGGAIGGGFAISNAVSKSMVFDKQVAQAANSAFVEGDPERTRAKASPAMIAALSRRAEALTGIDKTDYAQAIHAYVGKASDYAGISAVNKETGKSNLELFGMMAQGTGGSLDEIVRAAASLKASNPKLTTEDMMQTMLGVIGAGKKGNLPIEELAGAIPNISAASKIYAGNATENQRKMLGLSQLVGPATGGADETAMAMKHLGENAMISARTGRGGLSAKDIYEGGDSRNGLLDPAKLLANIYRRTDGRNDTAQQILGERGFKVYEALHDTYSAAGGGEQGAQAVEAKIKEFENVTYSMSSVMQDFSVTAQTNGVRLNRAFAHIEEVVEAKAVPFIERFATALEEHQGDIDKLLSGLAEVAEFMVSHPWSSLAMVMEVNVAKSIAEAAIGEAIKKLLVAEIAGGAIGGGAGGAIGGGAGGAGGAAGGIGGTKILPGNSFGVLAAGAYALSTLGATADSASSGEEAGSKFVAGSQTLLAETAKKLREGKINKGQAAEVYNKIQSRVEEAHEGAGTSGYLRDLLSTAGSAFPGQVGEAARWQVAQFHADEEIDKGGGAQKLREAMDQLRVAIEGTTGPGGRPGEPLPYTPNIGNNGVGDSSHPDAPARNRTMSSFARGGVGH